MRTPTTPALLLAFALLPLRAQQPPPGDFFAGPGPGGPMGAQELKLLSKYDKNSDGWLNAEERKTARANLEKEREQNPRPMRFGARRGGTGGPRDEKPPEPGQKVSSADVKSYSTPFYDPQTLRTIFIEFENADWEKELNDFHNTDVEVPARITIDGKTYEHVGIHYRGMSSYMAVGEGRKKSLNLALALVHENQNVGGYRTLNLLNAHEDPSFLRAILFYDIARHYISAPKANFARVVINGEDWGVYQNVQQFNKDFIKEAFGTTKGSRWKVRGSPGGQGSLKYLGDDPEAYKAAYTIKSKDDPKAWDAFIRLCKTLNETPLEKLEKALSPMLDIDGALKFLALDNALINNDGYWIRTSDYSLYLDEKGKFHIIPQDANETFARPGGGVIRFFGPANMLVRGFFDDGDKNHDQKLSADELRQLGPEWFAKVDPGRKGSLNAEQFKTELVKFFPEPPPGRPDRGPRPGPAQAVAPALFGASDQNKDGSLTAAELTATFVKWHTDWDANTDKSLNEDELQKGLGTILPAPDFGPRMAGMAPVVNEAGPGGPDVRPFDGPAGGPGLRMRPMPGPGNDMPRVEGVKLSPLAAAKDENKPLVSKLLAVPALKERYLTYIRDIAEKHLDWKTLGPIAEKYHNLIASAVRQDTRKLDTTEAFEKSLTQDIQGGGGPRITISLKSFADQRRDYLLNFKEGAEPKP